jgi:hypothetical protein
MKEEIMRRVKGSYICFVLWRKCWKDITALKFSKIQGPKHDGNYDATAAENGSNSHTNLNVLEVITVKSVTSCDVDDCVSVL